MKKCDYCNKKFETGGVICDCKRFCCSTKCDIQSHKESRCGFTIQDGGEQ